MNSTSLALGASSETERAVSWKLPDEIAERLQQMRGAYMATGLLKSCPRCGRLGFVFWAAGTEWFSIIWTRGLGASLGRGVDVDTSLTVANITNPHMGCGFDSGPR